MNILVTGAAGFIGSHLAERLSTLRHVVRGVDCFLDNYARALKDLNVRALRNQGIEFLSLDLAQDDLAPAVSGVDVVYHVAAQPGLATSVQFRAFVRNNITATHRLLEAIEELASCRCFVNISTSSVYGAEATGDETAEPRPTSYYGVTKLAAEQLALAYTREERVPACSIRLFSVYGPRERPEKLYPQLIRCALEGRAFPLFEGSEHHLRSYTYVGDAVDGLVTVLHHLDLCVGEIYNIGTDVAITTGEGIRLIEDIVGRPIQIARQPRRPGDQHRTHANIAKARRDLDYNPTTTVREGLEKEVAWYRQHILGQIDLYPDSSHVLD